MSHKKQNPRLVGGGSVLKVKRRSWLELRYLLWLLAESKNATFHRHCSDTSDTDQLDNINAGRCSGGTIAAHISNKCGVTELEYREVVVSTEIR